MATKATAKKAAPGSAKKTAAGATKAKPKGKKQASIKKASRGAPFSLSEIYSDFYYFLTGPHSRRVLFSK